MTRPRSPTRSEIEHILYANDIDFANFIDYHFSLSPTPEDEDKIKPTPHTTGSGTAGNDNTTLTPAPPSDTSDISTDAWVDRRIYMYYHPVGQIWLSYPPEGVTRVEDLYAVEEYGKDGFRGASKNLFDRLVDLGIRTLPRAVLFFLRLLLLIDDEGKRIGRKRTKRRSEGEDGRTM
ncbi:hypothetical protein DFP73DRAFT_530851 [Morchella snyderi]|nr:hypothetical protein DFP73DRAFT_530851 [Morchella snyderi]